MPETEAREGTTTERKRGGGDYFLPDLQGPGPQHAGPLVLRQIPRRDPLAVGSLARLLLLRGRLVGKDLDLAGGCSPGGSVARGGVALASVVAVLTVLPDGVKVLFFFFSKCFFLDGEKRQLILIYPLVLQDTLSGAL